MIQYFNDMLEGISKDIYSRTKAFMSDQIVILQPEEYVAGLKVITEDYHFVILQSTPPITRIGKKEYQPKKGSLISLEPDTQLSVVPVKGILPGKYIWITIKKSFFEETMFKALGRENIRFKRIENVYSWNLLDSVEKLKHELGHYGEKYPAMIQSISIQLIVELLRDISEEETRHNLKHSGDSKYISRAVDYMQGHYNSNITVEDISRTFHISTCHFQRIFKHYTGQTPYQYLLGIRIQRAKELLKQDQLSTGEVAGRCGFISQSHFSTAFKQIMGLSPSEYKKMAKVL